jgi:hypothetical protein
MNFLVHGLALYLQFRASCQFGELMTGASMQIATSEVRLLEHGFLRFRSVLVVEDLFPKNQKLCK